MLQVAGKRRCDLEKIGELVDEKRHPFLFGQASHFLPGLLSGSVRERLRRGRSRIGKVVD
jgi:hypothetical protein